MWFVVPSRFVVQTSCFSLPLQVHCALAIPWDGTGGISQLLVGVACADGSQVATQGETEGVARRHVMCQGGGVEGAECNTDSCVVHGCSLVYAEHRPSALPAFVLPFCLR